MPFHPLKAPLSECRIALITTAAPYQPGKGDQGPRAPYNAKAKFYTVYSGDASKDDAESQAFTLDLALTVLEAAPTSRTTVQSPLTWSGSPDWKLDYCNIERLTPEETARRHTEFDKGKAQAKSARAAVGLGRSDMEDEIA